MTLTWKREATQTTRKFTALVRGCLTVRCVLVGMLQAQGLIIIGFVTSADHASRDPDDRLRQSELPLPVVPPGLCPLEIAPAGELVLQ